MKNDGEKYLNLRKRKLIHKYPYRHIITKRRYLSAKPDDSILLERH